MIETLLWACAAVYCIGMLGAVGYQDRINRAALERINKLQRRLLELERIVFDPDATCPECGQHGLCDCCEGDCRDVPA